MKNRCNQFYDIVAIFCAQNDLCVHYSLFLFRLLQLLFLPISTPQLIIVGTLLFRSEHNFNEWFLFSSFSSPKHELLLFFRGSSSNGHMCAHCAFECMPAENQQFANLAKVCVSVSASVYGFNRVSVGFAIGFVLSYEFHFTHCSN